MSARISVPPRLKPIEAHTMGSTRSYDKQQKGEQCAYPGH
jgi:hypothetical protein